MKITNDYIDELSRRAAERYPLNVKLADWKKFLAFVKACKASGITNLLTVKQKSH
jgi:hypothetical protein